ncbi:MAG: aminotransferase class III-fold pyridoxal phosphate-dependent enzyme, partial [Pseudolabrys sp.]
AGDARRYCEALQRRGLLAKDTHEHTIRIAPPLVISSDQVDWALERIEATLREDFS